jgi:Tol biopolymer transport system component
MKPHLFLILALVILIGSCGTGGAGEPVTRMVLADASDLTGVLTSDGKHINNLDRSTGDVVEFDVVSGNTSRIKNLGPWSEADKHFNYQALFSRDGKQLIYNSYTDSTESVPELKIRNLDGSDLHTLYREKDDYPLDWSPDAGSILVYRDREKTIDLILISAADGSEHLLKSLPPDWYSLQSASFSPDGSFIAFSVVRDINSPDVDLFLMTTDGRNEVVIATHPAEDQFIDWTPDGKKLVFFSDRSGTWDICVVPVSNGKQQGEPKLMKKNFGRDSEVFRVAPDGSLYYTLYKRLGDLYTGEIDIESGKILVQPVKVETMYPGLPDQPLWSPDGKSLLYIPHLGYNWWWENKILTIRSDSTGQERILKPQLRNINYIFWAPDGRSIIANAITGTEFGIFQIDAETSGITRLAGDERYGPHLCLDGRTLVYMTDWGIKKFNLDTGEESEVVEILDPGNIFDLSPDGREVVFQEADHTVKFISLNGGEQRKLFSDVVKGRSNWWEYDLRWTNDGRYIIARAGSEIWRVPAQGGTPLKLDLSVPKLLSFALHPDNRRFVFTVSEGFRDELWVLKKFLPK